jgi:hypothetical protein
MCFTKPQVRNNRYQDFGAAVATSDFHCTATPLE